MDRSRDEIAAFRFRERPRNPFGRASGLHVAALSQLKEMELLAASLQRTAERCLGERRRFPHTLIIGPRDSNKRTLARAIAWEMAVPIVEIDIQSMRDLQAVDAKVAEAGPHAVVLLSGSDNPAAAFWAAERLAARRRLWDESDFEGPWMQPWERAQVQREALPPVTVIVTCETTSNPGFGHGPSLAWVERTVRTERNAITEGWRFTRILLRSGVKFDAEASMAIGERVVNERVRTLAVAEQLQELLNAQGNPRLTKDIAHKALDEVMAVAALPKGCFHHSSIGGTPVGPEGSMDGEGMTWAEQERKRKKEERRENAIVISIVAVVILMTCAIGTFAGSFGERLAADRLLGTNSGLGAPRSASDESPAPAGAIAVPRLLAREEHGQER